MISLDPNNVSQCFKTLFGTFWTLYLTLPDRDKFCSKNVSNIRKLSGKSSQTTKRIFITKKKFPKIQKIVFEIQMGYLNPRETLRGHRITLVKPVSVPRHCVHDILNHLFFCRKKRIVYEVDLAKLTTTQDFLGDFFFKKNNYNLRWDGEAMSVLRVFILLGLCVSETISSKMFADCSLFPTRIVEKKTVQSWEK